VQVGGQLVGVDLRGHQVAKDQTDWGRAHVAGDAERDVVCSVEVRCPDAQDERGLVVACSATTS
jgi:hypothetical protein